MSTLSTDLRAKLERTAIAARNLAEKAATAGLESLAVQSHQAYGHMTKEQKDLRNKLRARARQLGDTQDAKGQLSIKHLTHECAYEHWHRMLFARFLAENNLLIEPEMKMPISLHECKELAEGEKTNVWALAGRYAQTMLPEIFRADDPVLQVSLAKEDQLKLEQFLDLLPVDIFTASDSLGWCYQFWQAERKKQVNDSGVKIGADELPAVTQLFTEDYMVDFLLDNTLGAWHAARCAGVQSSRFKVSSCPTEDAARKVCALPGVEWKYLRFVQKTVGGEVTWTPAAGTFDGWPTMAKDLKCLDPCMGSGHFVIAMFERLVALRMVEEKLDEPAAVVAVIRENLFGLEIDPRCTQIAAFNLALAAWRRVGHCALPAMNLACSGLAPNAKKDDWTKLAGGNANLRFAMGALHDLFHKAPVLGSLINPRRDKAVTYATTLHELQPLLDAAIKREKADDAHELAVTARGLAKAAEILADRFTLVATNVPYLGRGKQDKVLIDYCDDHYPQGKADLATCFIERLTDFCTAASTSAFVTKQEWLFLGQYGDVRRKSLQDNIWGFVVRLGPRAFETISGERVNVSLHAITKSRPTEEQELFSLDVSVEKTPSRKAQAILSQQPNLLSQSAQLKNPDSRVTTEAPDIHHPTFGSVAESYQGIVTGDLERFRLRVWEVPQLGSVWVPFRTTVSNTGLQDGCYSILLWEGGSGRLHRYAQETRDQLHDMHESGNRAWERRGIALNRMNDLQATIYYGEHFDNNVAVLIPREERTLAAFWAYCSSPSFAEGVKKLDRTLKVTNRTLVKVPFDLGNWQKAAGENMRGLPMPRSNDPTQWLFNGHPKGADHSLHVAVARLLGYQWPRQTGSSFPDCPALGADGLEKFANADGIVCIPSVRGEEPAAERLRKLLVAAYEGGATVPVAGAGGGNRDDCSTFVDTLQQTVYFNPYEPIEVCERNLPHWRQPGVSYFVTFRLADALPAEKLTQMRMEREAWLKTHAEPYSEADQREYFRLFSERVQDWLDAGAGSCLLRDERAAEIVANALKHFDGQRYELGSWVVMPNHVHAVVTPREGWELDKILHSWKSFTSHEIAKTLGRSGTLWQHEGYDHIVRNPRALWRIEQYIAENPAKAGITTKWVHSRLPEKSEATVPVAQFPETGNRDDCSTFNELELIRASGSNASNLDEWLRNDFFDQHCDLFHRSPFVWHIWDGRKRDGFHALVNYHRLAGEKGKGRRTLESLTHSYLGDWITRQKDSVKRGEEGADERLAAALALKERLEAIIEGKPPFDIFVRWKPLYQQAIGWEPDINDGVRMNIRPFLASDLPNGKKGAGILRSKPSIKWEKDRGNEPQRPKEDFPWFWKDGKFTGERVNDVHLTHDVKQKARKA